MRITMIFAAAAFAVSGMAASAGGLSDQIVEAPVMEAAPAAPTSSISPAFIVLGVLAALLIASSLDDDDDDDDADGGGGVGPVDPGLD